MDMTPQAWPDWYDGRHINEVLFCQQFLDKHPMKCVRGRLFTVDGLIEDEGQIGNLILEEISGVLTSGPVSYTHLMKPSWMQKHGSWHRSCGKRHGGMTRWVRRIP